MPSESHPLISVIVPVYKVERYLRQCVDSILAQTYKRLEIILVDDGSPDGCPQICEEYARKSPIVRVFHKTNGGLGDARNYGVQMATAGFIAFVDSDDYVEPTYVEDLWNLMSSFDADLAITRLSREPEKSGVRKTNDKFPPRCMEPEQTLFEVYKGGKIGWAACGKLFKRAMLLETPFPSGYYEDCACMYKIVSRCGKIAVGDYENNYHYIMRPGSILVSELTDKHYRIFEICDEFRRFAETELPREDILPVIVYARGVVQLLRLQKMPWKIYRSIFLKYRPYFRSNFWKVVRDPRFSLKRKIGYALLCGFPEVYRLL